MNVACSARGEMTNTFSLKSRRDDTTPNSEVHVRTILKWMLRRSGGSVDGINLFSDMDQLQTC